MHRIGISLKTNRDVSRLRDELITPLRRAVESSKAGIYSNHLQQQEDDEANGVCEHLMVFQVHDFKEGLRVLRTEAQSLEPDTDFVFHNLNPSPPPY